VIAVRKISRRDFLRTTGLSGSALVLGVHTGLAQTFLAGPDAATGFEPNVFISIDEAGTVRLTVHRSEMGQGVRTSCAMLVAEELDVAWDDVEIVQATGDPKYGPQHTSGSRSIRTQWKPLRTAGAAAREMLVAAAAASWGVPAVECRTEDSRVFHPPSGRRLGYGELVAKAATLPVPENPRLKSPDEFRIIGRSMTVVDVSDMVQGKAVYGWDVALPGMLYASIERSPTVRGRAQGYDAAAARAVKGVVDVIELEANATGLTDNSVAVVAENTWAALKGRQALKVRWEHGPLPAETSADYAAELEEIGTRPGRVVREEGDFEAALAEADRVIEASYRGPYLVHAPMEPPAVTARVEGSRCEVWTPTQAPQWTRREVAAVLGIAEENVTVNVTLLGGAFGRKSKPDYSVEAAALAGKLGRPVRAAWTREDEVRHGFYRAQNFQYLKATLKDGRITGWLHRTVFPGIGWTFDPERVGPGDGELSQGFSNNPYRIPNMRLESGAVGSSLRIGWLRSVCNTFHSFAVNSFMDELARAAGRDPVAFHLDMLGPARVLEFSDRERQSPYKFDTGRLGGVIREAAKMAGWGRSLPDRHGLGFAAQYSFLSYVAMAVHASVNERGQLKVHEVDCAVDCGPVVNPDGLEAQMEGAVAFGLSLALYGKITVKDGAVEQGNFDDYPVIRMNEMPRVNVSLIQTDTLPTGIGEPGVPPTAPALCNAIFAATGKRIYDLPLAGQELG
jgi:isoquinoline 1-oxidoreductase beta subunit